MPLRNYQDSIPNGFQFFQPETGWDSQKVMPWAGWFQLRDAIIAMRQANPRFNLSIDPAKVEWEMDVQNTARLQAMPGTAHFLLPGTVAGAPPSFPQPQPRVARAAVAEVKRVATGIGVIVDMFGPNAQPVAPELSERRALICVECPLNERGSLLQRFTAEAVKKIQGIMAIVKEMELKTSVDSKLGICGACECSCAFKVHVPLEVIESKTSPETMAAFHEKCWIRNSDKV